MFRYSTVAKYMERLRMAELEQIRSHFGRRMRVLEIGGGNGLQAAKIAEWGCDVTSIDLLERTNKAIHFDVGDYDGKNIPFENENFDIVFSSNVLEHVLDIDRILKECKRVIKPDGLAIHIMPTPSWRFWTIVSHYPYLIGSALRRMVSKDRGSSGVYPEGTPIIPPPHGAYRTAFHELYYYSRWRWARVFVANGFQVSDCHPTGVFCSGYALFPNFGIPMRKVFSNILGSSGNIYILRGVEEGFSPELALTQLERTVK